MVVVIGWWLLLLVHGKRYRFMVVMGLWLSFLVSGCHFWSVVVVIGQWLLLMVHGCCHNWSFVSFHDSCSCSAVDFVNLSLFLLLSSSRYWSKVFILAELLLFNTSSLMLFCGCHYCYIGLIVTLHYLFLPRDF